MYQAKESNWQRLPHQDIENYEIAPGGYRTRDCYLSSSRRYRDAVGQASSGDCRGMHSPVPPAGPRAQVIRPGAAAGRTRLFLSFDSFKKRVSEPVSQPGIPARCRLIRLLRVSTTSLHHHPAPHPDKHPPRPTPPPRPTLGQSRPRTIQRGCASARVQLWKGSQAIVPARRA